MLAEVVSLCKTPVTERLKGNRSTERWVNKEGSEVLSFKMINFTMHVFQQGYNVTKNIIREVKIELNCK